jgi:DNA-binding NarL/FixJ family response regulator
MITPRSGQADSTDPIRVLLADDEALIRTGLRALISEDPTITVVGEAADGAEAIAASRSLHPDVVCMDVRMPHVDGIQATRTLVQRQPEVGVLILTTFENDDYVYDALVAGAHGFLLKRSAPDAVTEAIHTVHRRDSLLFPEAVRSLFRNARRSEADGLPMLSPREGEVLRLMAGGLSNAEIAARLHVGVETVKSHVAAILAKLGVRDRVQAVIRAYRSGFVALDD